MDRTTKFKLWGAISAGALALSTILPWITALGTSITLMDKPTEGPIVLAAAVATTALIAWRADLTVSRLLGLVAGLAVVGEAVYFYVKVTEARNEAEGFGGLISTGTGLYVGLLAGASLLAWAVTTTIIRRGEQRTYMVDGTVA